MAEVTEWIARARAGDSAALDRVFELLYPELRRVAHRRLSRGPGDSLIETTALVNECYLKLLRTDQLKPADRAHFLAYSATVMRSIIVDAARQARTDRRGGGAEHVELNTDLAASLPDPAGEIADVNLALDELARVDARLAQVVEMRYFAGMSDTEIGAVLGVSDRTVRRDWDKARLLLAHALRS